MHRSCSPFVTKRFLANCPSRMSVERAPVESTSPDSGFPQRQCALPGMCAVPCRSIDPTLACFPLLRRGRETAMICGEQEVLMRNHMHYIALLAIVLAPTLGCADRATAPVSVSRTAQLARDPQTLVPVDLGALGGLGVNRYSAALALSPTGDIVGWSTVPGAAYEVPHAVLWRDGRS